MPRQFGRVPLPNRLVLSGLLPKRRLNIEQAWIYPFSKLRHRPAFARQLNAIHHDQQTRRLPLGSGRSQVILSLDQLLTYAII